MKQLNLGLCYHPTTVGIIDDNKAYLDQLLSRLVELEKIPCVGFDNPQKALSFLTTQYQENSFLHRCLKNDEEAPFDHVVTDFNIRTLHEEIYNKERFNEISVLVIDYAMPGINGLELCRQLKKMSVQIIMLTGEASESLAVQAFNEGLIDKFILKNTSDLMNVLIKTIRELQKQYFLSLSSTLLAQTNSSSLLSCLEDSVFVNFFDEYCKKNNIVEYYLIDHQGSFLLLDNAGKTSWLSVANEDAMTTYSQLAEDDEAPENISGAIQQKQKIPFFFTHSDFEIPPKKWEKYLHPAHLLKGNQNYYYAVIKEHGDLEKTNQALLSYRDFMEKN